MRPRINRGLFKRFNLSLVTNPVLTGNVATETMADGQQLFVQTLLPTSPSAHELVYAAGNLNPIAELEPTQYILTVQDPTNPVRYPVPACVAGSQSRGWR